MIASQLPVLIVVLPLLGAFAISLLGGLHPALAFGLLLLALASSLAAALGSVAQVVATGVPIHYRVGDWLPPYGIELVIDQLNGMVLVMISGIALLVALYSMHPVRRENPDRIHHYYTLFALLVTGLLGITVTGDAFNLYVLLEIAALASYALLARGRGYAYYAAFKYLIMGTIGACFYLLGVGYLYIKTGTLNMADLARLLVRPELLHSPTIQVAFTLIMVGIWIKMAFFPLHGWLPNAYTRAATTTSCLIAPLMTKVSVYVMIRLMFSVFSVAYIFEVLAWGRPVVWLASLAIVAGSLGALAQQNLKRMLTYIIVAEVGYMVGGVWLANANGFTGAVYHILADGLMTACLFMAVGAVIFKTHDTSLLAMRNIFQKMPVTAAVFVVGGLAMIGVPPFCGFFSKWYLISGGVAAGQWGFVAALLFSSLVNAILFFRLLEIGFFGECDEVGRAIPTRPVAMAEAPLTMLIPMVITAGLLLVVGLYSKEIVTNLILRVIPVGL